MTGMEPATAMFATRHSEQSKSESNKKRGGGMRVLERRGESSVLCVTIEKSERVKTQNTEFLNNVT